MRRFRDCGAGDPASLSRSRSTLSKRRRAPASDGTTRSRSAPAPVSCSAARPTNDLQARAIKRRDAMLEDHTTGPQLAPGSLLRGSSILSKTQRRARALSPLAAVLAGWGMLSKCKNAANTSTSEAGLTSRQKASLHGMTGLTRVSHGVGAASRRPKEGNGSGYVIRVHP